MTREPIVLPLRPLAVGMTLGGMAMIGLAGARGTRALAGLALFCMGIAALDALHRRYVGFRQLALMLGIAAAGLGLWSALATGLLVLLEMRVAPELRSLLIASAICAAGSAATALLAARTPAWLSLGAIGRWLRGLGKQTADRTSRLGERRRDQGFDGRQPLRPAGPVQGG